MSSLTDSLRQEYKHLFTTCIIKNQCLSEVDHAVNLILRGKDRYLPISIQTNVPWYIIGIIHYRESSCDFNTHLHNGDLLERRTVKIPRNRPLHGNPPFTFEESAFDALDYDKLTVWTDWSIEGIAYCFERYNGFGYRENHPEVKSPYLWSFSNHYISGGYPRDRVWDINYVSQQCGTMLIVRRMLEQGLITIPLNNESSLSYKVIVRDPQPPLNVRSAPGTSHAIVGTLPNETVLTVIGKTTINEKVWLQINSPIVGWVAEYLTIRQESKVIQREQIGSVAAWQHLLNGCGYPCLKINGLMDAVTSEMTKKFQGNVGLPVTGEIDEKTWKSAYDHQKINGWSTTVPTIQVDNSEPAWMKIAKGEIGVKEIFRSQHNPRIQEYHKLTNVGPNAADETPWCSSFVCWCMQQAGLSHTHDAWAYNWRTWSEVHKLEQPKYGCIVVLGKSSNGDDGHVGFFVAKQGDKIRILGGNQGNAVNETEFSISHRGLQGYYWPNAVTT